MSALAGMPVAPLATCMSTFIAHRHRTACDDLAGFIGREIMRMGRTGH
jgi:hypothetical protein